MKDYNISNDDFEKFANIFMGASMDIMFETTYYCENNCAHCHTNCSTAHNLKAFMPEDDIFHILDNLRKHKNNQIAIDFAGGEISHIEDANPGYIKRIINKSLKCKFPTTLLTNGTWINDKTKSNRLLNEFCDMYLKYTPNFRIQMSFDSYHKGCIDNVHNVINALNKKLPETKQPVFPVSLTGFKHEPEFKNNLKVTDCDNLIIRNTSEWDLNKVGRAKTNNLPNCRDTGKEFEQFCAGNKFRELVCTPLYPRSDNSFSIMIIFNCFGNAVLMDSHNPDNHLGFTTPYKENNKYKSIQQIKGELAMILLDYVYGR